MSSFGARSRGLAVGINFAGRSAVAGAAVNKGRKGDHGVADGAADAATGRHGLDYEFRVRQQRTKRLAHVAIERRLPVLIFVVVVVVIRRGKRGG